MKNPTALQSFPKGISLMLCVLGLGLFLSGCTSTGERSPGSSRKPEIDTRSELVFLNIQEASGWVAYNCNPSGTPEMEDYRVVVIRQKSGEIIYDSQIPLAADLCTHGFEMAKDDPRLQRLAQNVDADIIDPLEAYQKSLEAETPTPEVKKPAPAAKAPKPEVTEPSAVKSEVKTPEVAEEAPVDAASLPKVKILGMADEMVLLESTAERTLQAGDRLFLRKDPQVIAFPGSDEKFVASEGLVSGLVQVDSVEQNTAKAKILSGEVPASGYAEKIETP